jgi:hypothetical protein
MKEKIFYKTILLLAVLVCFFALPNFVNAQSISVKSDKTVYKNNETVQISVVLDTGGKDINAIEGTIKFPAEYFDLVNITSGDSIFSLWPERPEEKTAGAITFAGGVPGGFRGSAGNIFNFSLRAKKAGSPVIFISNANVLLNDGYGTKLNVGLNQLSLLVSSQKTNVPETQLADNVPPEPFFPVIIRMPSVAENKYFVSFYTTDKQSGISYYQVKESYLIFPYSGAWFSTNWKKTETPYVLGLQHWWSRVLVRAYDGAGNYREEIVNKPIDELGNIVLYSLILIVLITLVFIITKKLPACAGRIKNGKRR